MNIGLARLSGIAIKRESTYGVINGTTIVKGLLVADFAANISKKTDRVPELTGMRQNARALGGGYFVDISFTVFAGTMSATSASLGELLVMLFGTDTISGASDPYTHTFTQAQSRALPSFSINHRVDSGTSGRQVQYTGFRVNTLTFNLERESGAISCAVKGMAIKEENTLVGSQVHIYNTDPLFSSTSIDIQINGASIDRYKSATLELNNLAEVFAPLSGARYAKEVFPKGFEASLTLEGLADLLNNPDLRAAFIADTINNATNTRVITIIMGDGTADRKITINIPSWVVSNAENWNISAADAVPEKIDLVAVNESDSAKNVSVVYTGASNASYNNLT